MRRLVCKPFLANAIRAGIKTETRRLLNPQPTAMLGELSVKMHGRSADFYADSGHRVDEARAKYPPGEIVGITEPWRVSDAYDHLSGSDLVRLGHGIDTVRYEADFTQPEDFVTHGRTRLARFLPDAFVRTRVRIVSVAAERVQDITEEQAIAEGIWQVGEWKRPGTDFVACWQSYGQPEPYFNSPRDSFHALWDSIHPETPWATNPFVFRYVFTLAP